MSSFKVKVRNPGTALARTRNTLVGTGGFMRGDLRNGGEFEGQTPLGRVRGIFSRENGTEIRITLTTKPFLLTMDMIQKQMRKYLAG